MKKVSVSLFFIFTCFLASWILASGTVDINTASLEQLDTLAGIGSKYAQAIIDVRPFSSVDDLLKVKGIGPKTLQKIKDQGIACVGCQTEIVQTQQPTQEINQTPTPTPTPKPTSTFIPTPVVYPGGVFISEILPSPQGDDSQEEWIELFNQNNFEVDLSGWKIKDTSGSIITYVFPWDTKIMGQKYLILKRTETKITLNNTEDGLIFLTPEGKNIDSLVYNNAPRGQSYNKTGSGWGWSDSLTPGSPNIIFQNQKKKAEGLSNLEKSDISNKNNKGFELAGVSGASFKNAGDFVENKIIEKTNPWFLFFTALTITIISGIIVLIIKTKFQKIKKI